MCRLASLIHLFPPASASFRERDNFPDGRAAGPFSQLLVAVRQVMEVGFGFGWAFSATHGCSSAECNMNRHVYQVIKLAGQTLRCLTNI